MNTTTQIIYVLEDLSELDAQIAIADAAMSAFYQIYQSGYFNELLLKWFDEGKPITIQQVATRAELSRIKNNFNRDKINTYSVFRKNSKTNIKEFMALGVGPIITPYKNDSQFIPFI